MPRAPLASPHHLAQLIYNHRHQLAPLFTSPTGSRAKLAGFREVAASMSRASTQAEDDAFRTTATAAFTNIIKRFELLLALQSPSLTHSFLQLSEGAILALLQRDAVERRIMQAKQRGQRDKRKRPAAEPSRA